MPQPLRILGIDPGSHRTGWGVLDLSGGRFSFVDTGTVHVKGEMASRLGQIADALDDVIHRWKPEAAAIESIFHAKNSKSALVLGQARGAALVPVTRASLPVFEYAPAFVKKMVGGQGRASKEQLQHMVRGLLGIRGPMGLDSSDALAVALCHGLAQPVSLSDRLSKGGRRPSRGVV